MKKNVVREVGLLWACLFFFIPVYAENIPVSIKLSNDGKTLALEYSGKEIFNAVLPIKGQVENLVEGKDCIEQTICIQFPKEVTFQACVAGSDQSLAAETRGKAQQRFPLIRTSHGLSNNLRNNAIYERALDWMLEMTEGTPIQSIRNADGSVKYVMQLSGKEVKLVFRPRYYQKHKNLPYYQPWDYKIYKESITGWSHWWAYLRNFNEKEMDKLLDVWNRQQMADYGYRFIQLDDVFQGEYDAGREHCQRANGYLGGRPTTWLDWKKELFPGGLNYYVQSVKKAGFRPAIWIASQFSDEKVVSEHPDWFVLGSDNKPASAPWVSYIMDATNPKVAETLIRPVYRGLKNAGIEYVKIDILRHYLYDGLHNNKEWLRRKGLQPADVLRGYLKIAREEMGDETFILGCWGVMPEAIGLINACRIGGDGYGPVTMQQYNSWNGLVWRNDPDHCDILPKKQGVGTGNITTTVDRQAVKAETVIRPALASIAGAALLLSDKPEVYEDETNLLGLKRVSPVVFSVPGQLYDFDPSKTDWIKTHSLEEIVGGANPAPLDGDQFGEVCPFWLNEFNTGFDAWVVLHRMNWPQDGKGNLPASTISFSDLGLDASKDYLVYEFWSNKMLGVCKGSFRLPALAPNGIESLAIREKLGRPQLLSTNRHLSQGAVEIQQLVWDNRMLKGRSNVIAGDEYILTFYVPSGYKLDTVSSLGNKKIEVEQEDNLLRLKYMPDKTESLEWKLMFTGKSE